MRTPWLLLFLLLTAVARAGVEMHHLNARDPLRSGAPIPLRLKLAHTGGIVEGRIQTTLLRDGTPVLVHRSQPLTLTTAPLTTTILVPPAPQTAGELSASLQFLTSGGGIALGIHPLGADGAGRFIIAHVKSGPPRAADADLARNLSLERFLRGKVTRESNVTTRVSTGQLPPRFSTHALWLEPDDVPSHPLAFCAYDCVVLDATALAALRARQLEALAQWVEAGGRVIATSGPEPGEAQAAFLARITGGVAGKSDAAPRHLTVSYGRAALLPPGLALTEDMTRDLLIHICGIRPNDATNIRNLKFVARDNDPDPGTSIPAFITQQLLPDAPKPIAVSTVVAAMLGFVAVAVVGDYLFLGWLRRRRWTWLLFPTLAAGFTAGTIAFAHRHMNAFEQTGTLRVIDLTESGRVIREHSATIILPASSKLGVLPQEQALTFPFDTATAIPQVDGSLTGASTFLHAQEQWTPVSYRSFTIRDGDDPSGIRWEKWQPRSRDARISIEDAESMDPGGNYYFTSTYMAGVQTRETTQSAESVTPGLYGGQLKGSSDEALTSFALSLMFRFSQSGSAESFVTVAPPGGSFITHVSRENLAASGRCLIIAIRREGRNITAYRKLHRIIP